MTIILKRFSWLLLGFSSIVWGGDHGPSLISSLKLTADTSTATVLLSIPTPAECENKFLPMSNGSLGKAFYEMLATAESSGLEVIVSYNPTGCLITKVEIVAS